MASWTNPIWKKKLIKLWLQKITHRKQIFLPFPVTYSVFHLINRHVSIHIHSENTQIYIYIYVYISVYEQDDHFFIVENGRKFALMSLSRESIAFVLQLWDWLGHWSYVFHFFFIDSHWDRRMNDGLLSRRCVIFVCHAILIVATTRFNDFSPIFLKMKKWSPHIFVCTSTYIDWMFWWMNESLSLDFDGLEVCMAFFLYR